MISKASVKPVSSRSVEVKSGEEDAPTPPSMKYQFKKDKKISAQSSQIKDLQSKLDQAVAENSQIRELLSPATMTTVFTNALTASKTSFANKSHYASSQQPGQSKPFLGSAVPLSSLLGRMVSPTLNNLASIVRIQAIC